jgi:FdrA protein
VNDRVVVRKGSYHDSARLMAVARELQAIDGIEAAEVMMGTPANRELLAAAGFAATDLGGATPMDMVVALRAARPEALEEAERTLAELLAGGGGAVGAVREDERPGSVAEAVAFRPQANLVSIAVPGAYAAFVAHRALDAGRHVFLFSDNVPLADEVALKRRGVEAGLLVMGPDCGTAIVAGCGLGFANRVPRGPVGIVGASGTGIQEVSCLLAQAGVGVSHAIGTGSRDLSAEVGGVMAEMALRALGDDPGTGVVVLVAKHPDAGVAARLHGVLAGLGKPAVVRYLGEEPREPSNAVRYAATLDEAAGIAVALVRGEAAPTPAMPVRADERAGADAIRGRLIGLFGGGSLAAEAQLVLRRRGVVATAPAEPLRPDRPILGSNNLIVDLGDDAYTVGRPHPMVDQSLRCALIEKSAGDPGVAVVLLDLVLGDGAHRDPAPEIAAAVARGRGARGEAPLAVVCSLCGCESDPQGLTRQEAALCAAGITVATSAAQAAAVAAARLGAGVAGSAR